MARRSVGLLLAVAGGTGLPLLAQSWPESAHPGLPMLPDRPELLVPLRPVKAEVERGSPASFRWRGERVVETYQGERFQELPEGFVLEKGWIQTEDRLLVADRLSYRRDTGEVEALGNIRLEAPGFRLRCERLRMNWVQQVGEAWALTLEVPPEWTLRAQKVAFTTLKHWSFEQVEVNACPQAQPGWVAKVGQLAVDLDGFATLRRAWIWLGPVPTPYYLPWAIYPAKAERTSGLLPPSLGHHGTYGFTVGVPYFQALGDRTDITVHPEYFSRQGMLWGGEFRWHPEPTHQGAFSGQWIKQRLDQQKRYRMALRDVWQREDGWQLMADVNQASDTLLEADYGRGVGALGTTTFDSSAWLGRAFSWANFSVSAAEQRSFFLPDDPLYRDDFPTNFRRQSLPTVQVRVYPVALGPLYIDAGARISKLTYRIQLGDDLPSGHYTWGRDDLWIRAQGRLGQWGPVRSDLQFMGRISRYGASLPDPFFDASGATGSSIDNPLLSPFQVDGPGIARKMLSGRWQLAGPQVGRLFENFKLGGWQGEVKHVLEAYTAFTWNSRYGLAGRIPRFDEVDSRPGVQGSAMGEQSLELGLKQHFFGRPGKGMIFADLVRWRSSVRFHFLPILQSDGRTQQRGWGSVDNDLDVEPDDRVRLSFRRSSDLGENGSDNALSAEVRLGERSRFSLAAFSTGLNRFLVRQRGIQLGGQQHFLEDRLRLEFQANYAFPRSGGAAGRKGGFASSQVGLAYVTPCVATMVRYTHVALQVTGSRGKEDRVDVSLNLRGLGDLFTWRP